MVGSSTVAETGHPGGKGLHRLSPRGVQEGREVDPGGPPVQSATRQEGANQVPARLASFVTVFQFRVVALTEKVFSIMLV